MNNSYPKTLCCVLLAFTSLALTAQVKKTPPRPTNKVATPAEQRWLAPVNLKDDPSPVKIIDPTADTVKYIPGKYYIKAVIDVTDTNDSIGYTLQPKSGRKQKLALKDGTAQWFTRYFDGIIAKDTTLYPVIVKLKQVEIYDERIKNLGDETTIKYAYDFISVYKQDSITITSYSGTGYLRTSLGRKKNYDSVFNKIPRLGEKIDEYMQELDSRHPSFCKGVKVKAIIRSVAASRDSIFYNSNYRLSWDDYRGEAEAPDGLMSYFMIDYDLESDYKDGYVVLDMHLAPTFIRSMSWVNGDPMKSNVLAHENYKFKLVYLFTLQFKKQLESLRLTYDNYRTMVPAEFKKMQKALNEEITAYYKETNYGLRKKEQQRWQEQIDQKLSEVLL